MTLPDYSMQEIGNLQIASTSLKEALCRQLKTTHFHRFPSQNEGNSEWFIRIAYSVYIS